MTSVRRLRRRVLVWERFAARDRHLARGRHVESRGLASAVLRLHAELDRVYLAPYGSFCVCGWKPSHERVVAYKRYRARESILPGSEIN